MLRWLTRLSSDCRMTRIRRIPHSAKHNTNIKSRPSERFPFAKWRARALTRARPPRTHARSPPARRCTRPTLPPPASPPPSPTSKWSSTRQSRARAREREREGGREGEGERERERERRPAIFVASLRPRILGPRPRIPHSQAQNTPPPKQNRPAHRILDGLSARVAPGKSPLFGCLARVTRRIDRSGRAGRRPWRCRSGWWATAP